MLLYWVACPEWDSGSYLGGCEDCSDLDCKAGFASCGGVFVCYDVQGWWQRSLHHCKPFIRFPPGRREGTLLGFIGCHGVAWQANKRRVQESMLCKLHGWFLLNKMFPRTLGSKFCISRDTTLVVTLPTLKWVFALIPRIRMGFHPSWRVARQFFLNWIVVFKWSPKPNVKSSHPFHSCFIAFHLQQYRNAGLVSLLK